MVSAVVWMSYKAFFWNPHNESRFPLAFRYTKPVPEFYLSNQKNNPEVSGRTQKQKEVVARLKQELDNNYSVSNVENFICLLTQKIWGFIRWADLKYFHKSTDNIKIPLWLLNWTYFNNNLTHKLWQRLKFFLLSYPWKLGLPVHWKEFASASHWEGWWSYF